MIANIVIGIRENFKEPAYVMLYSLLVNNKDIKFNIFILSDEIDSSYFTKLMNYFACNIKIIIIDIEDIRYLNFRHIDISTFYRLKIDKYIPNDIERILYLDTDLVVNGSILELLTIKLEKNQYIAAVKCGVSKIHLKKIGFTDENYFNAGLILFDFQKCLEKKVFSNALDLIQNDNGKFIFMDQDVLNLTLKGNVKFIDNKWNYGTFYVKTDILNKIEKISLPIIVHYTGRYKPWHYMDMNTYSYLYRDYYRIIYKRNIIFQDRTLRNIIKKHIIKLLYNFILTRILIKKIRQSFRK